MRIRATCRALEPAVLAVLMLTCTAACSGRDTSLDAKSYVENGERLLLANDLVGAEKQFLQASQSAPNDGDVHVRLAQIYVRLNNFSTAEAELLAAKRNGVKSEPVDVLLSEVLFRSGEIGQLLREIPASNRSAPTESVVRAYRGLAELGLGNTANALAMLDDAEHLDPRSVFAKVARARILTTMDLPAADRKVDEALAIDPKDTQALDTKGFIAVQRKDAETGMKYYNDSIKENPRNIRALLHRADLHLINGDVDRAVEDVGTAKRIDPRNGSVIYLQAEILAQRGNYRAADAALSRVRGFMDRLPESYLFAGKVKYQLGESEQAETYLSHFVARRQDQPEAYEILGTIALARGNKDRAVEMLTQALKLEPGNTTASRLLEQARGAHGG